MFCGLGEEERTKIRKKKKEKKRNKLHRGQKWVGWDERGWLVGWDTTSGTLTTDVVRIPQFSICGKRTTGSTQRLFRWYASHVHCYLGVEINFFNKMPGEISTCPKQRGAVQFDVD